MARRPEDRPRISLNKLCEFMSATPPRQRRILKDQKFPNDFKRVYYREAQDAVAHCIASNLENVAAIERQIEVLNQQNPDNIGTQRRIAANIDALEAFLEMADSIDLGGAEPRLGENAAPRLTVRNVDISVRPEIILRGEGRSGPLVGALKLHFPKTNPLNENSAGYVSAVLQEWCATHLPDNGAPHGPLCFVVDVGSRCSHAGVRSTVRRMRDIQEACETIAALWPTLEPD